MSIYVGMDVHRKRSQVAIVDDAGEQQRNRNLPNDPAKLMPILGGLPPGTAVRSRLPPAGGWLVELESEPHLVHPSRCKVIASAGSRTTRSMRPLWPSCCGPCCVAGRPWCGCRPR
jgi:transposase